MFRVLTYHRVADPAATPELDPRQVSASPDDFRLQVRHLASSYEVVGMDRVLEAFRGGRSLPERAVLITFDDAYRDFGEVAWPILREYGLPATVFVPTGFPGSPCREFWWDRIHRVLGDDSTGAGRSEDTGELAAFLKTLPPDEADEVVDLVCAAGSEAPAPECPPVLDWHELRTLRDEGVDLGSHTRTHPALVHATEDRIREELRVSMSDLAAHVGERPRTVCYPYGLFDDRVVRIAREEGFELGFTSLDGLGHPGRTDPLRLPRTNVTRRTSPFVFRVRMHPWFARVDRWRHRDERRKLEARRRRGGPVTGDETSSPGGGTP